MHYVHDGLYRSVWRSYTGDVDAEESAVIEKPPINYSIQKKLKGGWKLIAMWDNDDLPQFDSVPVVFDLEDDGE